MKNISRRVFIKGMAVAAVATAASTVLTGCKLPTQDPTGETEEVTAGQTFVYEDVDGKKLTIEVQNVTVYNKAKLAVLSVKVANETANDFNLVKSAPSNNDDAYYIDSSAVKVYFNDEKTLEGEISDLALNGALAGAAAGCTETGYIYVNIEDAPKDWKKMTLTADVKQDVSASGDLTVKSIKFDFNK